MERTDMSQAAAQRYRIGFALEPKKVQNFLKPSLVDYAKQHAIDLIQIDPAKPLLQQGPFHCIIHKLHTQHWNNQLHDFSAENPNVVIIDPPESVDRLSHRVSMLEAVTQLRISPENGTVGVPNQVVVNEPKAFTFNDKVEIEELGLKFPVIAKPLDANGTADCHKLWLVFDPEGLKGLSTPFVLQEFVNHGGVVFKIYVAGQHVNCVKRKSLVDLSEEELKTLKGAVPISRISNMKIDDDKGDGSNGVEKAEMPPFSLVIELARALREALGLNLFNVDLIRDGNDKRRYLIIDINYFPGYAKFPGYEFFFTNFLLDVVKSKTAA